jgi:hypothetical protein
VSELAQVRPAELRSGKLLEVARRALAEVVDPAEFALLVDQAEVVRVAAKAAGLPPPAINDWTRYKIDCERAAAEAIERLREAGELASHGGARRGSTSETRRLKDLNITWQQADQWGQLASLPKAELDAEFAKADRAGKALAEATLVKMAAGKESKARREASRTAEPLADGMELRTGDAREVLADVPDGSVHLVLTDPPYGDEAEPLYRWLAAWSARVLVPGGSLVCYTGQSRLDRDMAILSGQLRYWWTLAMLHHQSQRLPGKFVVAEWKPVLWYVKEHRRGRSLVTDVLRSPARDKSAHAWAQGEGGAPHLIEHLTDPGELVADPFAGSRRWGRIAAGMGRRWVGADIEQGGDGTAVVA